MREKCPAKFFRLQTLKEMQGSYSELGQSIFLELTKNTKHHVHQK